MLDASDYRGMNRKNGVTGTQADGQASHGHWTWSELLNFLEFKPHQSTISRNSPYEQSKRLTGSSYATSFHTPTTSSPHSSTSSSRSAPATPTSSPKCSHPSYADSAERSHCLSSDDSLAQCAMYASNMLNFGGLRTHAVGGLNYNCSTTTVQVAAKRVAVFPKKLISRGTLILEVEVLGCPGSCTGKVDYEAEYIVKFSAHSPGHPREEEFVWRARSDVKARAWLMHLPNILTAGRFKRNEALVKLREGSSVEYRELRYLVAEKLQPIIRITDCPVFAKVFREIIACHRFLVEHSGILHRDGSVNNFMYRMKNGVVYGVLNDFDLAAHIEHFFVPTLALELGRNPSSRLIFCCHWALGMMQNTGFDTTSSRSYMSLRG
ncbi:hypothetical protein PM082_010827 [Marasmius tenuissimus]|nr:hypothetical protein PM082_010827 [Marasmius tenuissimus]